MTLSMFFDPFYFIIFGAIFLNVLVGIACAPLCVHKILLICSGIMILLYGIHGDILYSYIKVPEKSMLQVYEGKVHFDYGKKIGKKKGKGAFWLIVDKQGNSHRLFCVVPGSFIKGGCNPINTIGKKNFEGYNNKPAIVYYSNKFGIMEAFIDGEEIYNYEARVKKLIHPPDTYTYVMLSISAILFLYFVVEIFKNHNLLANFFSNPIRYRHQWMIRHQQLLEKEAQNI